MSLFEHVPHVHIARRKETGPVKVRDQLPLKHSNPIVRFNAKFALACTAAVGSMYCAYLFGALAVAGLPTALKPGNIGLLFWVSSDFLQLTLLSVIIVGQNIQAQAADKRAEQTYEDAEAVLHEAIQIQQHLAAQDEVLERLIGQAQQELAVHVQPGTLSDAQVGQLTDRIMAAVIQRARTRPSDPPG